jgi:hypothetical protein
MFASFSISHNIRRLSIGKLTRNRSEGAPNFVGSERDKRYMPRSILQHMAGRASGEDGAAT